MEQLKLFEQPQRYPVTPGYKRRGGTSEEAAKKINPKSLRARCLRAIREGPKTADEIALILKETVLSVRPRISELYSQGEIADTLRRRLNQSGKRAVVWEVKT